MSTKGEFIMIGYGGSANLQKKREGRDDRGICNTFAEGRRDRLKFTQRMVEARAWAKTRLIKDLRLSSSVRYHKNARTYVEMHFSCFWM